MSQNGTVRPSATQTAARPPSGPPTLNAFRTSDGVQLAIWCVHCKCLHFHGAVGPMTGEGSGHRGAHCTDPRSPYLATGYIVREVSRVFWVIEP